MENAARIFTSGLDCFQGFLAIAWRNGEALGTARQKMLEGMGVLVQRQAEMAEETWRRSVGIHPSVPASPADIQAAVIGQIDSLKTTMMEFRANTNILSELAARSSGDVAEILQTRMLVALDEVKTALEQAAPDKLVVAA